MLLQEDKVLHNRKTLLLFIGILTVILIFTPYLEINNKQGLKSVTGTFFQDITWDDLDTCDYVTRSQKSKDTHQEGIYAVAQSTKTFTVFKTRYALDISPDWIRPAYYDFLFRYTLF